LKRLAQYVALIVLASLPLCAQQVIDRVVTVVNGRVITQSEWQEEESFETLAEGKPPVDIKRSEAALDRLIDRVLLLQQMAELNFRPPTREAVRQQVEDIKKQLPSVKTANEEAWRKTLAEYGIPEDDFQQIVTDRANVARFVDVRFRANARISPIDVDAYYKNTFVPEFQKTAAQKPVPPLKDVQDKIQQIVVEQRVTEDLDSFIQSLRAQAVIRKVSPMEELK
jgi:hypothetical protein